MTEELIKQDLQKPVGDFQLIRAKSGVHVYRCIFGDVPAVVKYFENESDRREILNYRILAQQGVPTIKTLAFGDATLVLEDISASENWRLGVAEDFADADVAKSLAEWYFTFHESGAAVSELGTLYFEYDSITEKNLKLLLQKFPEAKELFQFVLHHYGELKELIYAPSFTLTYNDFYWTNFVVQKDKTAAMMFDYNLMGRGYRFSDLRNVYSSLSDKTRAVFTGEYNRLYLEKHGHVYESDKIEESIDDLAGPIFALFVAFTERETFPHWAEEYKNEATNGYLLSKAKRLLL